MRSYPVKKNPIGSAVSEILRYKQTDRQTNRQTNKQTDRQTNRQTDIVLLCIIDILVTLNSFIGQYVHPVGEEGIE